MLLCISSIGFKAKITLSKSNDDGVKIFTTAVGEYEQTTAAGDYEQLGSVEAMSTDVGCFFRSPYRLLEGLFLKEGRKEV